MTIIIGRPRTAAEFSDFAIHMAWISGGRGFRTPGREFDSTSLVEQASTRAGDMEQPERTRSKRGERKASADKIMKAAIAAERVNGIDWKYLSAHARRRLRSSRTVQLAMAA